MPKKKPETIKLLGQTPQPAIRFETPAGRQAQLELRALSVREPAVIALLRSRPASQANDHPPFGCIAQFLGEDAERPPLSGPTYWVTTTPARLLESRAGLHDVRDFLGHANITTTSRYLRSTTLRLERALTLLEEHEQRPHGQKSRH